MCETESTMSTKKPFPPLPPLPCSSSLTLNKENGCSSTLTVSSSTKKKRTSRAKLNNQTLSSSKRSSAEREGGTRPSKVFATNQNHENIASINSHSPSVLSTSASRRRVLRDGETMEGLFLLEPSVTTPEHMRVCESIIDGKLADDAAAWVQVIKQAVENQRQCSKSVRDLMRLFRRATSRFSSIGASNDSDALEIWLQYAIAQAQHANAKDARSTFRNIQIKMIGADRSKFYCAFADFEQKQSNQEAAIQVLKLGMARGAKPEKDLTGALAKLTGYKSSEGKTSEKLGEANKRKTGEIRSVSGFQKRLKSIQKEVSHMESDNMSASSMSTGTISLSLASLPEENSFKTQEQTQESLQLTSISIRGQQTPATDKQSKRLPLRAVSNTTSSASKTKLLGSGTKSRSKFFSARLQSTSVGTKRLGLPEKIGTSCENEEDDSFDMEEQESKQVDLIERELSKPVPKYTKVDLNYMLNWEPARKQNGEKNDSASETAAVMNRSRAPSMKRIDETTSGVSGSTASAITFHTGSTGGGSAHTGTKSHDSITSDKTTTSMKEDGDNNIVAAKTPSSTLSNHSGVLSQCNADFMPLIYEKNILTINGSPFVKLGVIGKGGSCKVYRALSKECSVVAIKKVKLGNLDKKAIDGYANEIALLQRLRGNPAIIQIHESEVDLSRKAIFVVMELGEVDLNHVLQQQALKGVNTGGSDDRARLNLNFIRLTWYQMLHCVHSIHEERIIHGDLKPANFLFVRGALKLIDFGIAKAIQSDDTTNIYRDSQIGTLNYMSPEAILDTGSGKGNARWKCGRASDIWSLGCILYQMVYGRPPFAALHMIQKLQAIVNPNYAIEYPSDVDEAAIDAIRCCLDRKPEKRSPIVGKGGLLDHHHFLNGSNKRS